ncbi:Xaa-Pro peptidase family protein [Mesorhizobium sp.]|uniref:M24 family metallopeptidase n=1 Tax=Mesorhizobium sp. TaxID=1871066 RepID=UPI0025DAAA61|nr:Xaa-Pro peptidase family protein [Mesorhizobium sp.]
MQAAEHVSIKTIPYTKVTPAEYEQRIENARRLMRQHGIDALLVTGEQNLRYFMSDISTPPVSTTRPRFLLIPLRGELVGIVPQGVDEYMSQTTAVKQFRTWPGPTPADEGVTTLSTALRELLPPNAKIGTELGAESRLGMPVGDFLRVAEAIKPQAFVDASNPIFTPLRMVKSPAEINNLKIVNRVASEAFQGFEGKIRQGMTQREIGRRYEYECLVGGIDKPLKIQIVSGPGGVNRYSGAAQDIVLSQGDILYLDQGCLFDNYFSDFCRYYSFGEPDRHSRDAYDIVWDATQAGVEAVKPGIRACDVWKAMADVLNTPANRGKATTVGRMGHSMGLWMPELPSIQPSDETVLQPGMILNIEPGTSYPATTDGSPRLMLQEEVVLVTETGAELLTLRTPRSMPVVEA